MPDVVRAIAPESETQRATRGIPLPADRGDPFQAATIRTESGRNLRDGGQPAGAADGAPGTIRA
ncbi:hypothetical protein D3C87_1692980 [compost metagenome]